MPRPIDQRTAYEPALDGIRALAVAVVVTYHLGVPQTPGGLLGVGVFFTLSGYLITSILLASWRRSGGLELATFWIRRAKRLLPALFLVLAVVMVATALVAPDGIVDRWKEAVASAFYVSNWTTILGGASYFDRFTGPGPLDHLWSLAIEEQFYLFWPLLLLAMLKVARGRLRVVLLGTVVLAATSFLLLAVLASPGFDNTRAYEGTDTRAGGLLIGAALAMVWQPRLSADDDAGRWPSRWTLRLGQARVGRWLDVTGVIGIGTVAWLVVTTDDYSMTLYTWGLLALSVATAGVIAASVHPASRVVRPALSVEPLRWIGERSYGIYLWHLPVIAFTPDSVLEDAPVLRGLVQVAITVCIAALSWTLLEDPIRRYARRRVSSATSDAAIPVAASASAAAEDTRDETPVAVAARASRERPRRSRTVLVSLATRAVVVGVVATTALSLVAATGTSASELTVSQADAADQRLLPPDDVAEVAAEPDDVVTTAPATPATPTAPAKPAPTGSPAAPAPTASSPASLRSATAKLAVTTSCKRVVHVGDSTSTGLTSKDYLPKAGDRIDAQYKKVGIAKPITDISGARSIVETWHDQPNARAAVTWRLDRGYSGCWVFAMGTNDSANQAVGSRIESDERIDRLMKPIKGQPAMWVMVKTLISKGPYANKEMQAWNAALVRACDRYPNMRVYDWPAQVQDGWYIKDGIHFTSRGYKNRGTLIARALAAGYPSDTSPISSGGAGSRNCVIRAP
jgi:peptidoglycan/LPS O-acetylase OafA/YrhL